MKANTKGIASVLTSIGILLFLLFSFTKGFTVVHLSLIVLFIVGLLILFSKS